MMNKRMKTIVGVGAAVGIAGLIGCLARKAGLITNSLGQEWDPIVANIQPAIDASVGGWVSLPQNTMFITPDMILIPSHSTLYGNGSTIKASDNFYEQIPRPAKNAVIANKNKTIGGTDDCSDTDIHIYDLTIDGNGLNNVPVYTQYTDQASCLAAGYNWAVDCRGQGKDYCMRNGNFNMYCNLFFKGVTNSSLTNCKFLHGTNFGALLFYGGNTLVKNCEFANMGEYWYGKGYCYWQCIGLECMNGSNWTVEDSVAHDCFGDGFGIESTWASPNDPDAWSHDWVVRRCKAYNLWGGFWAENTRDGLFEDCEAYNCTNNEAYNGNGIGFVAGGNSFNIQHTRCYSHDNGDANFSSSGYHHILYDHCIARNAKHGFSSGSNNCTSLAANPPYAKGYVIIQYCEAYNHSQYGIDSWAHFPTIMHNIIDGTGKTGVLVTCGGNPPPKNCHQYDGQEWPCKNNGGIWVNNLCYCCQDYDLGHNPGGEVAYNTITHWCQGDCTGWPYHTPLYPNLENVNYHDNTND